jgi:hypothetical protein
MNSAFYRSTDYLFARPSSDDGKRVATTITLIAVATCMILAKSFAAPHPPGVQSGEVQTVRIVDPDFCKNQTWPYIDARCLKRIAPDQPVAENHAGIVSANPQVTPAPAAPLASAVVNGAPASGSFAVSDTSDAAGSAMHSTPPTAVMNDGAGQNDIQETIAPNTAAAATDNSANARVSVSHYNRGSRHWQHGAFFGFRF